MNRERWVIHAGGLPMLVHPVFRRDLREIAGCADAVYLYASEHEIRPYGDTAIFKDALRAIHDHGLKVIVSVGTGYRFSAVNPCTWHFSHPELWLQMPRERGIATGFWPAAVECCCVNNPTFIGYAVDFYRKLLDDHEVDGIGFDEPRELPCLCEHCRKKYRQRKGRDMSGSEDREHLEFQAESLAEYLTLLSDLAKQRGKLTASVVSLQPHEVHFHSLLGRIPSLDYFGIDPYWFDKPVDIVGTDTAAAKRVCDASGKRLWVVIQGFHIPSGREQEITAAGRLAAENGADVLCGWFHWRGTGNPELAWDTTHRMLIEFGRGAA